MMQEQFPPPNKLLHMCFFLLSVYTNSILRRSRRCYSFEKNFVSLFLHLAFVRETKKKIDSVRIKEIFLKIKVFLN